MLITNVLGESIDEETVRRILRKYYKPIPGNGPSWLVAIGNCAGKLWSVDLFRLESVFLRSYWVMVVMDQFTRQIIGFGVHQGTIDGGTVCYLFNQITYGKKYPKYLSSDNDPLFIYYLCKGNLEFYKIEEIKTVPDTPWSHPFVESLIGISRREFTDYILFWTESDLAAKFCQFQEYFNSHYEFTIVMMGRPHPKLSACEASLALVLKTINGNLSAGECIKPPLQLNYDSEESQASSFLAWAIQKYTNWDQNDAYRARKNYLAYLLALNTGMRAAEIWGLKPQDFCFDETGCTLFVRRQFNRITKEFAALKGELVSDTDKSRHVPCPKELRVELERHVKANALRNDQPVFQSVFGNPVDHDSFADRFDRDVRKWGGKRIRFHDLRHTAATLMLAQGIDVKTVKEILGHEDISTTMRYLHLIGGKIRKVSETFSIKPGVKLTLITGSADSNLG